MCVFIPKTDDLEKTRLSISAKIEDLNKNHPRLYKHLEPILNDLSLWLVNAGSHIEKLYSGDDTLRMDIKNLPTKFVISTVAVDEEH